MSRLKEYRVARDTLDNATNSLLNNARNYAGVDGSDRTRDVLRAAREYARAFTRVETMRGKR